MARSRKFFTAGAVGVAAVALIAASSSVTGAYFSDAAPGNITGTIGSVRLSTSDTTFAWSNMMPGEQKSATVTFQNTGTGLQDFYLVFPNATALSALNDLGTFGEVHVSANGVEKFASTNLTDHWPDLSPGAAGVPLTHALPNRLPLASDVGIGSPNSFTITFKYAGKLGDANPAKGWPALSGGGVFNTYPVSGQTTTLSGDGNGSGLPFKVVAVQVGQTP